MIRCTNKPDKFKNLTLNKEYDATEENDNYILLNDAGISARYAKKYFTTVVARPVAMPIVEALQISETDNDSEEIVIEATIGRHRAVRFALDIDSTPISCGIDYLSGIAEIKRECTALYNRLDHNLYTGSLSDLFRAIMEYIFSNIAEPPGACYIMSDQSDRDGEDPTLNVVLNNMAATTWTGTNDNSGNDIVVWIFNS